MRPIGQSIGLRRRTTRGGMTLIPIPHKPLVSNTRGISNPWALLGVIEAGPAATIYVAPGIVNNAIPTIDVSGTPTSIASVPAPGLVVTGSSGSVYLKATIDAAGSITDLIIESASSVPSDTSTEKHKLIGTWTSGGGIFTSVVSILNANQTLYMCGTTAIWEA